MSLTKKGQAKLAEKILVNKGIGFQIPTSEQKITLQIEFAKKGKVIYGKAYDIIKIENSITIDLDDPVDVANKIDNIILIEIKSTGQKRIGSDLSLKQQDSRSKNFRL